MITMRWKRPSPSRVWFGMWNCKVVDASPAGAKRDMLSICVASHSSLMSNMKNSLRLRPLSLAYFKAGNKNKQVESDIKLEHAG